MTISESEIRALIMLMWKQRLSPRQIAQATALPVDNIYRHLKRLEKELVKKEGVENYGQKINI